MSPVTKTQSCLHGSATMIFKYNKTSEGKRDLDSEFRPQKNFKIVSGKKSYVMKESILYDPVFKWALQIISDTGKEKVGENYGQEFVRRIHEEIGFVKKLE